MSFKRIVQIYSFFLTALLLVGCTGKKAVDVSHIDVNLHIERFDKDLGTLQAENIAEALPVLEKKYSPFYRDFVEGMLNAGSTSDTAYYANMRLILQNKDFSALNAEISSTFKDLSGKEEELRDAFKHINYYQPAVEVPRIISFFSGFGVQVPLGEKYIGIGLDMFLGADSKFYPALQQSIPRYISRRFTPENITPRVIETFVREDMFPEPDNLNTLMDRMIYNGKILFFMQSVLPNVPDSLIINYTGEQQQWADKYEADIWGYFLERNLLYESDYMKIQKFLTEAPFTPGIGERNESAPKLALYIGWQIVKKYMERNEHIDLPELMKNTNYQQILTDSHYKPK
ncbi:MAG: gliding motility lipoprotein GldB [Arcticibacter sp.]